MKINQIIVENFDGEYDDEAGMAQTNLHTIARAAQGLLDTIDDKENLPEWVQEKIAKVEGMMVTAWDYLLSQEEQGTDPQMMEAANAAQQAAIAISMKKANKKPKNESAELEEEFDLIESIIERLAQHNGVDAEVIWEDLETLTEDELYAFAVTSEPIMESQGVAEDANLNYIWIQGDFDGDTASSGATQGSWRDQQSTPVKLTRGRMINVRPLSGPPPEGGKTIKQAQIPLTLDAGEQKFSTTGVDLQLTVAPNGYVTNGEVGRVRGTAVVKIMRPESVEEDLTRRGFLRGLGAAALAGAAGGALAGSNDPNFVRKVHDQHNAMIEKNPRYAKEHDALGIYLARGIAGASAENNKRWVEKTAKLLQKYGVNVNEGMAEDWQKANKRDRTDGMSQKAVNAYRRENPGSKLKTAVTTKPSKLKKGGKASKRRKSYCSRSRGQMKMHSISCAKTPDKAICKARRRWNC
jgi:hypothetical protein